MDIITSPTTFLREKAHPTISPMIYSQAVLLHNNFGEGNHPPKPLLLNLMVLLPQ